MLNRGVRGSTPQRTWSTATVPEPEQFAFWKEVVWEAFIPVSVARVSEGSFVSSITAHHVGPLGVSRIASPAQSVARTQSQVSRQAGDIFFLNLPLTDTSFARQDGRTARLRKGDFAILDSSRPFELGFENDFQQISLTLPHDLLAPLLATPGQATAVRVRGDRGIGAVASGALRAFARTGDSYDRQAARSLTNQLASLVALALGNAKAPPASAAPALLMQAALDEVERSLSDPNLSPPLVAERVAISTRYLHQLFSDRGTSFGRWVLARRLQRCRQDLTNSDRNHWTIAAIACENGFRDPSYFARAFKAHYGISPHELRADELTQRRVLPRQTQQRKSPTKRH
jgi:AraC family transcriptional regulator, positive regulator of tynA and feaB